MSPIGRVFIILNLIAAGTFVGFSGSYLQKQFNWKTEAMNKAAALEKTQKEMGSEIERLRGDLSQMTTSKSSIEQAKNSLENELAMARDEVKRLHDSDASKDADLKKLASELSGIKTNADAAFKQSSDAYQASIAAGKDKDEAIRTRDASQAENRELKNQIAALNETIQNKDVQLADGKSEIGRLTLLVDVAKAKGFMDNMAVPSLAGTVAQVQGKLCTIMVTDNPTNAEIKPGTSFAIWDASGYKAEARVTSVDSARNAAFCTLEIKAGEIKQGDKAATHVSGL